MSSEKNIQNSATCSPYKQAYRCPKCHDTGYESFFGPCEGSRAVYGDETPVHYSLPCSYCNGGHSTKVENYKKIANIPHSCGSSTLKDFKWDIYQSEKGEIEDLTKQRAIVEAFVEKYGVWKKNGIGLYIYSHMRGSGKTFLASCICNELIERYPMMTRFVSAADLISIAKSSNDYDKDPIDLLCNCELLCLDDLGQKSSSDWTNDILFRIMDHRMQNGLVTIITSNLSIAELQIDDRIVDRINSVCTLLPLPEYRIRSQESKRKQIELFKELGIIKGKAG